MNASAISAFGKKSSKTSPLTGLFSYLRDLFSSQTSQRRFDREGSRQKRPQRDYFPLDHWQRIQERLSEGEAHFALRLEEPNGPLLSLRSRSLPDLRMPQVLEGWVSWHTPKVGLPRLSVQEVGEQAVSFEADPARVAALHAFRARLRQSSEAERRQLAIPEVLQDWVRVSEQQGAWQVEPLDRGERFEADPQRAEAYLAFEQAFEEYLAQHAGSLLANQLYEALHETYYLLKSNEEQQLYLSFGLVSGQIGGEAYQNYLFHAPLKLKLNKGCLELEWDKVTRSLRCEPQFVSLLPDHFQQEPAKRIEARQLQVMREADRFLQEVQAVHWSKAFYEEVVQPAALRMLEVFPRVRDLSLEAGALNHAFVDEIPSDEIWYSLSPVLQLIPQNTQQLISRDASRIIQEIQELNAQGAMDQVPDFFQQLFTKEKAGLRVAFKKPTPAAEPAPVRLADFLFPLPCNQEQLAIAQRLEQQDAVTVKGPPGTGKSHTIANLASHAVAQGKSVLIVSKYAKALEVLRGKLPGDIKDLAVSLLQSGDHLSQMKHAIDTIKDRLNHRYEAGRLQQMEAELEEIDRQYERLLKQVEAGIAQNHSKLRLWNPRVGMEEERTAAEWAHEWTQLSPAGEVVRDEITAELDTRGWAAALAAFSEQGLGLSAQELNLAPESLPSHEGWVAPDTLDEWILRLTELEGQVNPEDFEAVDPGRMDPRFSEKLSRLLPHIKALQGARSLLLHPNFRRERLEHVVETHRPLMHEIATHQEELLAYEVLADPLEGVEPYELEEAYEKLLAKYGKRSSLPLLQRKTLPAIQKAMLACKVNGREVLKRNQLEVLGTYIVLQRELRQLHISFSNFLAQLGLGMDREEVVNGVLELQDLLEALQELEAFNAYMKEHRLPALDYHRPDWVEQVLYVRQLDLYKTHADLALQLKRQADYFQRHADLHPLFKVLEQALLRRDVQAYTEGLARYERLQEDAARATRARQQLEQLGTALPQTVASLKQALQHLEEPLSEQGLEEAFFYLKLTHFLESIHTHTREQAAGFQQLRTLQQAREQLVTRLVAYKSWYHKSQQVTDKQKAALTAWRNDLVNIGKGHGKNTARNQRSAIQNLRIAKGAVPIWIMTQETALSFFPEVSPGQFDLLIVDEASQCDISLLNLIFRAKKCLIVGDENQTSVATRASLFPIDRTNQLLDRYLGNNPFRQQFNINNRTASIYSLSGVIYPNIVSLREHFRCLPEIIGFSNKQVYNGQVVPLKNSVERPLGSPLAVRYVEDAPEDRRKPMVVQRVLQEVLETIDAYEAGRLPSLPTVGVLTLDASKEAHRELLVRELSRHPKLRAYEDELQLLVGTSREFQGDERDLMLLTVATGPTIKEGQWRAPRAVLGEEMMRIYNVAASRAKERMVLFHSLPPEIVAQMKPNCYRRKLIDYLTDGMEAESWEAPLHLSPLTAAVAQSLEAGLGVGKVFPRFGLGPYVLDLAVFLEDQKWAVFLDDGPVDDNLGQRLEQQLLLERVGWRCLRVSAVDWWLRGEGALEVLLRD